MNSYCYIRYCKKCKKAYDRGIQFELCPECRMKKIEEVEDGRGEKRQI